MSSYRSTIVIYEVFKCKTNQINPTDGMSYYLCGDSLVIDEIYVLTHNRYVSVQEEPPD